MEKKIRAKNLLQERKSKKSTRKSLIQWDKFKESSGFVQLEVDAKGDILRGDEALVVKVDRLSESIKLKMNSINKEVDNLLRTMTEFSEKNFVFDFVEKKDYFDEELRKLKSDERQNKYKRVDKGLTIEKEEYSKEMEDEEGTTESKGSINKSGKEHKNLVKNTISKGLKFAGDKIKQEDKKRAKKLLKDK